MHFSIQCIFLFNIFLKIIDGKLHDMRDEEGNFEIFTKWSQMDGRTDRPMGRRSDRRTHPSMYSLASFIGAYKCTTLKTKQLVLKVKAFYQPFCFTF